jgi:hypothetical protein
MERVRSAPSRRRLLAGICLTSAVLSGAGGSLFALCGPFTDVSDAAFCPFVLEIFTLGITTGTTATTYDPSADVTRLQMAAFLSRTVDAVLERASLRTVLGRFWPVRFGAGGASFNKAASPALLRSDGSDVWVALHARNSVARVRGSDGTLLETWTGTNGAYGVLVALGQVIVSGDTIPGVLWRIDPSRPAGVAELLSGSLGIGASGITFDGSRIWTANTGGSVSIVTPGATTPWTVTTVTAGFTGPLGALYDGANVWVTDNASSLLFRLDGGGTVLQTITTGGSPGHPTFDGENLWVPTNGAVSSVLVVRAKTGAVLATLTGNGLLDPRGAAFDGQRILVTSFNPRQVSLFKAADLTAIESFDPGIFNSPFAACSDAVSFWVTAFGTNLTPDTVLRF